MNSKIILAKPVTKMPATQIKRADRVEKSLLKFAIGSSFLFINIAFTTSR